MSCAWTPAEGTADCLRIALKQHGSLAEAEAKKLIEAAFSRAGIGIASQISMAETRKIIDEHLVVITVFLTSMPVFTIVVGFLGLASALSLSVLERRREIGVMRATGATPRRVMALIMSEGLVTTALSWVLGVALSLPLSLVMGRMLGTMLLSVPLDLVVNPAGLGIWFCSAALIGAASRFFPALSAAQASLREVLAYE